MLLVLVGEDDYSIHEKLEEIKKGVGDLSVLPANMSVLEGQALSLEDLRKVAEAVPFLAEKRLVIVYGLVARFAERSKPGKSKASYRQSAYQPFAEYLLKVPQSTIMVLVDYLDKRAIDKNPFLKELSAHAEVLTFPVLKDARLRQWIQKRVQSAGGTISGAAVDLLVRFVGGNLWAMANEIDKLTLFAAGRRIEEEDVRNLVSFTQEASIFALVDAIMAFRLGMAEQVLQKLLQQGATAPYVLTMLARQVQLIVRVKELQTRGRSKKEIQDVMSMTSDYVVSRALEQAERYSLARLKEVYHSLLEADVAIKTGRYDPELALEMLIAELCPMVK